MREIKFRAWDKDDKEMREVTNITFYPQPMVGLGGKYYDYPLMQYTGLKETIEGEFNSGGDIYEGDFVGDKDYSVTVEFHDGIFTVGNAQGLFEWMSARSRRGINTEVIGNVWENPELVKTL